MIASQGWRNCWSFGVILYFALGSFSPILSQQPSKVPVHSVIDLEGLGCARILDFSVAPQSIYALCLSADKTKQIVRTTLDGQLLQKINPPQLRHGSCGLAISPAGRMVLWGRASAPLKAEVVALSEAGVPGPVSTFEDQVWDIRFLDDARLIAANSVNVYRGQVDPAGLIAWRVAGFVNSAYPLLVLSTGNTGIGVLDMLPGTLMTASTGAAVGLKAFKLDLPRAPDLPINLAGDDLGVPMCYGAGLSQRGEILALIPGFRHEQGSRMVVISPSGAVTRSAWLEIPTHPSAVRASHPHGHMTPIEIRGGQDSVFVLSMLSARIARYVFH